MNHNEIERKRREEQKEQITLLRESIPSLQGQKCSTVYVVSSATEYIHQLRAKINQLEGNTEGTNEGNNNKENNFHKKNPFTEKNNSFPEAKIISEEITKRNNADPILADSIQKKIALEDEIIQLKAQIQFLSSLTVENPKFTKRKSRA